MFNPLGVYHPFYNANALYWDRYRRAWESGDKFVNRYLKTFSARESDEDFVSRRDITPSPGLVKAAIQQLRNSIFSKMKHVVRDGGSRTFAESCLGINGGIDLQGSTMNTFMAISALEELMVMGRVGIYVDMPPIRLNTRIDDSLYGPPNAAKNVGGVVRELSGPSGSNFYDPNRRSNLLLGNSTSSNQLAVMNSERSIAAVAGKRPYCYLYQAEQIRSWRWWQNGPKSEFQSLLLVDLVDTCDDDSNLPNGTEERYRRYEIRDTEVGKRVFVSFYDASGDPCSFIGAKLDDVLEQQLDIDRIPFILMDLPESLLCDAVMYQIAIMNLNSSDIAFALYSNFPLYTEPYDPRSESPFIKRGGEAGDFEETEIVETGAQVGKRYPFGQNQPAFINPSPEPMRVSMEKQAAMKEELRNLIHMSVASLAIEQPSLDNGLGYLAGMLQVAEMRVAEYWQMYENVDNSVNIIYPTQFQFVDVKQAHAEVDQDVILAEKVTSPTLKRELMKKVVAAKVGNTLSIATHLKIVKEIDGNDIQILDSAALFKDIEAGVVSLTTASKLRGYPAGDVEVAKVDHAERLARIQASQAPTVNSENGPDINKARGVADKGGDTKSGKDEKAAAKDNTKRGAPKDVGRGPE